MASEKEIEAAARAIYGTGPHTAAWEELSRLPGHGVRGPFLNQAKAALEAAEAVRWQPIESAPKDGTEVDLWAYEGRAPACHYHCDEWMAWGGDPEIGYITIKDPTHWRRIPAPPESKSK